VIDIGDYLINLLILFKIFIHKLLIVNKKKGINFVV